VSDRSSDDIIAVAAVIGGAATAWLSWPRMIDVGGGMALGFGGVLLALRGDKVVHGRAWIRAAFVLAILATALSFGLGLWAEWTAGSWLAEGAHGSDADTRQLGRLSALLRLVAVAFSACFLVGAVFGPTAAEGKKKGPDARHPGPD
jgi:hypothetical protein